MKKKKEKICRLVDTWQFRRFTLLGKITVIKLEFPRFAASLHFVPSTIVALQP